MQCHCINGTGHVLTIGCHMHDRDLAAWCLHCVYQCMFDRLSSNSSPDYIIFTCNEYIDRICDPDVSSSL